MVLPTAPPVEPLKSSTRRRLGSLSALITGPEGIPDGDT